MSSLGKDLATIRLYLKWTLEDLHKATRIPLETLKRIEDGSIFDDPNENSVYVRSFVRTYARALKLDDELTTASLDLQQKGEYNGEMLEPWPDIDRKTAPHPLGSESGDSPGWRSTKPEQGREKRSDDPKTEPSKSDESEGGAESDSSGEATSDAPETTDQPDTEQKQAEAGESQTGKPSDAEQPKGQANKSRSQSREAGDAPDSDKKDPAGRPEKGSKQAGSSRDKFSSSDSKPASSTNQPSAGKPESPKRKERDIDWVKMGHQINQQKSKTPNRIIGVIGTVLLVLIGIYIIFWTDLIPDQFGLPEMSESEVAQTTETDESGQDLSLGLADEADGQENQMGGQDVETAALPDTLHLTVYAATDRLDPVRVWSDLKPRIDPYWLEQGTAYNFEFQDTIRVRGTYSNMLLFLNGHLIENPRQEHYNPNENSVELTRSLFSSDPVWGREQPLDLPDGIAEPDSIQLRPTFN